MDRQAFKQRMQNLKSYRENNPGKGYWDWKVEAFADGGEVGDPEKERFYQATGRSSSGRPLEEGLKPVFSLEDAANMTPIGDAISAKDAYDAVKNRDWLGAGLAASAMIPSTDNIKTAEDYPKGLIRHEIGHYVDEKAYPGGVPNNAYLRQLGKPSKYRSFSEVEHMFPDKDRAKSVYEYLRKPTEKKSIMNQFDEYLMNTLTPSTYPTNTKQFRQVIESAPDLYNNMKMLLKIHTKPSVLYKDFLARPLVNKINKNKNQEIV